MYPKPQEDVEKYRITKGRLASVSAYGNNGAFEVPGPERAKLFCIVSDMMGWEHVSVSVLKKARCPSWAEMCFVKELFWMPEEAVMQLHPRQSDYVSFHDWTLHMWRPVDAEIPLPPHTLVGPKDIKEALALMLRIKARG